MKSKNRISSYPREVQSGKGPTLLFCMQVRNGSVATADPIESFGAA
jgi:hypothetical protein